MSNSVAERSAVGIADRGAFGHTISGNNTALFQTCEQLQLPRDTVVAHPATNEPLQFAHASLHRDATAATNDLAYAMLETLE